MKKKVLFFVLAVISVIAIWAVSASAASESDLTYEINYWGQAVITGCNKDASGELVIPSSYKGYPVKNIESEAFAGCSNLTSITIPDTLTYIGSAAFNDCTGLTSIHITDIAAWCNILFGGGTNPLQYAGNLYLNGELVTDLVLPDDVEEISAYAFYGCTSLKSITIPDSVTYIGSDAFNDCTNFTRVNITDINAWLNIEFGYFSANPLYTAGTLYLNGELVTELNISDDIKEIKDYAFTGCTSLESITIPDSVTDMGTHVFYICTNLTDAKVGNGITNISNSTFAYCLNLKSVTIPGSVTAVDDWAFSSCDLKKIYYKGTDADWKEISISDGNEPLANASVHYIACTKTDISEDGKTFSITPKNIENGKIVILALYDGNKFVEMQHLAYTGNAIPFTTSKTYDRVKVMVWNDNSGIKPVCDAENAK